MKTRPALFWIVLWSGVVLPLAAPAQSPTLLITITNPAPALKDYFGYAVAAVGSDRVVVGAHGKDAIMANVGIAYLFSTNGNLLTTFTNPAPADSDQFGQSVAALGNDCVLVGAHLDNAGALDAGTVYLFNTNGTLLTTFTNPTPANYDYFGYAVAAVGTDRVVIGAYQDDTGTTTDTGVAYLFSTNGTLLTTFTDPAPAASDWFGQSVAAVGSDCVVVGAPLDHAGALSDVGAAYLFSTDGALLTTFTNPAPVAYDYFGRSVAAVGSDRVLIGAYQADMGAADSGVAYLFSTNGALLTTFTNPTPANYDYFGYAVAAVGTDRVVIGAYQDDTGSNNAGAAYVFSTSGTLLTTITNPAPMAEDLFGRSLAALGNDCVLVGAHQDDGKYLDTGSAYLFRIPALSAPRLAVIRSNNAVVVSWPWPAPGWVLEWTNVLREVSAPWPQILPPYQTNGTNLQFTEPLPLGNKLYRLRKP